MSYLIGQLFICLLVAGLAGFLIGWILRKYFLSQAATELEDAWSAKYQKATREIDAIRAELKDAKIKADAAAGARATAEARLSSIDSSLADATSRLNEREMELSLAEKLVAELRTKLAEAELKPRIAPSPAGSSTVAAPFADVEAMRRELASAKAVAARASQEREAILQRLAHAEFAVKNSTAAVEKARADAMAEISSMRGMVAQLEPLRTQLASKEAVIKHAEQKIAALAQERDQAVAKLNERTAAAVAAPASVDSQDLDSLRATIADLETRLSEMTAAKDRETAMLAARITERDSRLADAHARLSASSNVSGEEITRLAALAASLEPLRNEINQRDERLANWDLRFDTAITEKDADIARLRSVAANAAQKNAELEDQLKSAGQHQAEIAHLRAVVNELEPLRSQIVEKNRKLADLEIRFASATGSFEDELARLRDASNGVEPLQHRLAETESRLSGWNLRFAAVVNEKDAEIVRLRSRVTILDTSEAQLAERDKRVAELESWFAASARDRESEVAKLKSAIAELEPLAAEKDDEIRRLRASLGETHSTVGAVQSRNAPLAFAAAVSGRATPVYPRQILGSVPDRPDDLRDIWGVGPVLAKRLNSLGVYYFRQIANWSKDDVEFFKSQMDQFQDRIEREDWISGAREEHFKKYGEAI